MSVHVPGTFVDSGRTNPGHLFSLALWLLWQCIRLPLFLLFAILEPVITSVLGLLALLGILTALFWKLAGYPHFPFLSALGASLLLGLMLAGHQALLRLLAR